MASEPLVGLCTLRLAWWLMVCRVVRIVRMMLREGGVGLSLKTSTNTYSISTVYGTKSG